MKKSLSKLLSILLAAVMLLTMVPFSTFAENGDETTLVDDSPLHVEVTADKPVYTLLSIIQFKVTITNTSDSVVNDISAAATLGKDLLLLKQESQISTEAESLAPGESVAFSYRAKLNVTALKRVDKLFIPFMLIRDLFFDVSSDAGENDFDDGRETLEATQRVKFLSFYADAYTSYSNVKVCYQSSVNNENYFTEPDESNVIRDDESKIIYVNNELLITAKEETPYETIQRFVSGIGGRIVGYIGGMDEYQVRLDSTYSKNELEELIAQVKANANIHNATVNYGANLSGSGYLVPGDPWGEEQNWDSNLPEGNNWGVEAINAPQAWDHRDEMNPIKIGLIDIGFDTDHEDLTFAWTQSTNHPDGHGTHVAGTMAADWNEKGISGVMPTSKSNGERLVDLLGVPIGKGGMDSFKTIFTFEMKSAFAELILRDTKVINLSQAFNWTIPKNWGEDYEDYFVNGNITEAARNLAREYSKPLADFLKRAMEKGYEFLLVGAAGNDNGIDAEFASPWNAIEEPIVRNRIIVVGAVKSLGIEGKWNPFVENTHRGYEVCDFSNLGNRVDVMAPGYKIFSTTVGNEYENKMKDGKLWSGTSMAAPHVSGVAAMVWSINPNLTGAQVKEIVNNTADRPVGARGVSYNIVNAENAVNKAIESKSWHQPWQPEAPQNGAAVGRVVKQANEAEFINGALIAAYTSTGNYVGSAMTDASGQFELMVPGGNYILIAYKDGYIPGVLRNITIENQQVNYIDWFKLVSDNGEGTQSTAQGTIYDAVNNAALPGVTLAFKNVFTQAQTSTTTSSGGQYHITLPVGYYEVTLSKSGYVSASFNVAVSPDTASLAQNATMSPVIGSDEYRMVLTWGENPRDLDSHIEGPLANSSTFHVYYGNKNAYDGNVNVANLDVDDTTSYGPETVTLRPTATGTYKYYIHHFSGSISTSGAQVKVYRGSTLLKTYNAPTDQGTGIYWNVFSLENGIINDTNTITNSPT